MSLKFAESFDHLANGTADLAKKWGRVVSGSGVRTGGRRATKGCAIPTTCERVIGDTSAIIVGGAFFIERSSAGFLAVNPTVPFDAAQGSPLYRFLCDGELYLTLGVSTDGGLRVTRGTYPRVATFENASGGGTALATSAAGIIRFNSWNWVEMRALFGYDLAGSFTVWVNDTQILHNAACQTIPRNPADDESEGIYINPEHITQFQLIGGGDAGVMDDIYVNDEEGSYNNARLGDLQVDFLRPDGAGAESDSDIVGTTPAATRWQSVDETEQNGGVDAVRFDASGEEDSYTFTDLPYPTATIFGVQVTAFARKSDSGIARAQLTTRVNALDLTSPDVLTPSAGDDYGGISASFDESADGAWDLDKVNDSEFGFKRVA
jgi:hypothetical protein